MEYLILSDSHFEVGTKTVKINFYTNLISKYDNIILNGDFYEAKFIKPNTFLNSKLKPLLDALHSKNVVYLYGNHDPEVDAKRVAEYISNEQAIYKKVEINGQKYHIEHGNRLAPPDSDNYPDWLLGPMNFIGGMIQKFLPFVTMYMGTKWNNSVIEKRYNDGIIKQNELLICGHTHVTVNRPEINYINSGSSMFNGGNYIVINETGYKIYPFRCLDNC